MIVATPDLLIVAVHVDRVQPFNARIFRARLMLVLCLLRKKQFSTYSFRR
jgi:hypothetical protein